MKSALQQMNRSAVTLVEVIISIGVVLIGMLGLLSILPLAGQRARDAIGQDAASEMGDAVLKELQSRRLLSQGNLIDMYGAVVPTNGASFFGFCLDPLYVANQNQTFTAPGNGYADDFFPCFFDDHDPLLNPSDSSASVIPWPAVQPRLQRVGLDALVSPQEMARMIAQSPDDLLVTRPQDRSRSLQLLGLQPDDNLEYGRRVPAGEFSWLATVSPLESGRFASVSVVVIRNRDANLDFPSAFVTEPRDNGVNERIAYVSHASGFQGGAGGTVFLAASVNTLSSLRSNDWVMLSREVNPVTHFAVHRWYRVASVANEATKVRTDSDPSMDPPSVDSNLGGRLPTATGTEVWLQKVLLDGADWDFGFANDSTTGLSPMERFRDNTFATIVQDVVSVTERIVRMDRL